MLPSLRLFNGVALTNAHGALVSGAAAQPRRLAVLAIVAAAWPSTVTRDRVIGLLWPDQDDAGARRLLTQALYALRRDLGEVVEAAGQELRLNPAAIRTDLVEFREALARADDAAAVRLHGGPVLDGFNLRGAPEFEHWLDDVRRETQQELREALDRLVVAHERDGRTRELVETRARLVRLDPYDAAAVLHLVEACERAGRGIAAREAVETYVRRMRDDLGVEPDPSVIARLASLRPTSTAPVEAVEPDVPPEPVPVDAPAPAVESPRRPAPAREQGRRSMRVRTAVLLALAAIGVPASTAVISAGFPPPADGALPAHAASPRTVRMQTLDWVGDSAARVAATALVPLLASALVDVNDVHLVPADATDSAHAETWARLGGVVLTTGGALQVQLELRRPAAGDPVTRVVATGSRDSLSALADRLALELLPSLHDTLPRSLSSASLRGTSKLAALRHFLDGEAALARGDVERAHAEFQEATEADPRYAFAWYRRAETAERTLRPADADSASAIAVSLATALPTRERLLVQAFAAWRAGDALRAESIYQRLVRAEWKDPDAWLQLAEIAYHTGPLHGRPVDVSRDAWDQLLRIDSMDATALAHALRLSARRRDTVGVRELMRRTDALPSPELSAIESRLLATYAVGDEAARRAADAVLDTLPDYSLYFLHAAAAGLLERPDLARPIARRLVAASRPVAVRAQGHVALAHLAFAEGRREEAWRELDRARALDATMAAWAQASLAAVPFVTLAPAALDSAERALAEAPREPSVTPLSLELVADLPAAPVIHAYLAALLRAGRSPAWREPWPPSLCESVRTSSARALCADLTRGLDAEDAIRTGATARALRSLEAMQMVVPYQLAGRSVFLARTRERWRRAELLDAAGRLEEADGWYAAVPHAARLDYVYLAASHLRRGRSRERAGERAKAAAHYQKVAALLRAPDREFLPLRQEAEAGLRRLRG